MELPKKGNGEIIALGAPVIPGDAVQAIAQEIWGSHRTGDVTQTLAHENNLLHRLDILNRLNIVGTSGKDLVIADNQEAAKHHAYSLDRQGKVKSAYRVVLDSQGNRLFQKLASAGETHEPASQFQKLSSTVESHKPANQSEEGKTALDRVKAYEYKWPKDGYFAGSFVLPARVDRTKFEKAERDVPRPKAAPSPAPEIDRMPGVVRLHEQQGVFVNQVKNTYQYLTTINGKYEILFTTEANQNGLDEAEIKLKALVDQKIVDLHNNYHVTVERQRSPEDKLVARLPRLDELSDLETAVVHSRPSQLLTNDPEGRGLRFVFLEQKSAEAGAYYMYQNGTIYVEPSSDDRPRPEVDAKGNPIDKVDLDPYSYVGEFIHEIGHNAQRRWGWHRCADRPELVTKAGWAPSKNNSEINFLKDKEGFLYKPLKTSDNRTSTWIRCNDRGESLDAAGNIVLSPQAVQVSNDDMINRAAVTPPTSYFTSLGEMWADGYRYFKTSQDTRIQFAARCPSFYQAVKEQDQSEIDATYGKGIYIRSLDGILVPDTPFYRDLLEGY